MLEVEKLTRDCRPSSTPLKSSYYHGACAEPLSGETIGEVLRVAAKENPDHEVFRTHEFQESITLHDLHKRAGVVSRSLLATGLKRGDIVFLVGVTDIEYYVLYFAVTQIGLVFLYPQIDEPFEKDTSIYLNMKPAAIFVGREVHSESVQVIQEHVNSSNVRIPAVCVNVENPNSVFTPYTEFLEEGRTLDPDKFTKALVGVSIDDVAVLFPSSEVIGLLNPVVDDAGCVVNVLRAVYNRATVVIGPPSMTPTPDAVEIFMSFVEKERITWHGGMPFELIHSLKSPARKNYDLSSLRGGNLLGQITSAETKRELVKLYPHIATLFGSTEALAGLSTSVVWSTEEQLLNTVGYPYAHCEVKLVDSYGRTVATGEQGELCIRGWSVFKEYLNDWELTTAAKDIKKNGWYHYGDMCTMDETGHVTYIGRKSDCVRFKHYSDTVYPIKILNIVERNEKVQTAKVIGIPSDEKGDDICLCVEPKQGMDVTEKELEDAINAELQENMRPDYYLIFDSFPRTGARRKVATNQLKELVVSELAKKREQ